MLATKLYGLGGNHKSISIASYPRRLYSRRRRYSVKSRLSVCLLVRALKGKMAWAIDTKLCTRIFYSSLSASIDPEVKRSKSRSDG